MAGAGGSGGRRGVRQAKFRRVRRPKWSSKWGASLKDLSWVSDGETQATKERISAGGNSASQVQGRLVPEDCRNRISPCRRGSRVFEHLPCVLRMAVREHGGP